MSMLSPADPDAEGPHGAFNLGQLLGLHGLASLLPLLLIWAIAAAIWFSIARPRLARTQKSAPV